MNKSISKIGLAVKSGEEVVNNTLQELLATFSKFNLEICFIGAPPSDFNSNALGEIKSIDEKEIPNHCELIIVVGGDGTFLRHAKSTAEYKVPILGINCGRVGFFTEVARSDIASVIPDIIQGKYVSSERIILCGKLNRNGEILCQYRSINDLVLHSRSGRMMEAALYIDDKFVYCERSDGIIIATSSGSTAYAMSAGGPIIVPQAMAIEVVNISPHNLTSRPLVLPDSAKITIEVKGGESIAFYADGWGGMNADVGDKIEIQKDIIKVPLIHHGSYDFFSACRSKLGWHSRGKVEGEVY